MDKTNIYLQFSDFTTGDCINLYSINLYLGTIFGNLRTSMNVDNLFQVELPLTKNFLMIS